MQRVIWAVGLAIATGCSEAAMAQAQVAPGNGVADLGEIVVTAQKREQSINSVGLTVATASGDQLATRGITNTADLVKLVPGFTFTQSPFYTPVFTLRGVGLYDSGLASSPTVALYVDEVAIPFPAMARGETLDLERVEVLKGPQGTLFGQSSTGGAINYIAAKPTNHLAMGAKITVERFGRMQGEAFVSGPITDTLKVRAAMRGDYGGAWQYSVTRPGDEMGKARELVGRVLMDWTLSDRARFQVNVNGWRDHSDMQAGQLFKIEPALSSPPAERDRAAALLAPSLYTGDNNRAADWTPGPRANRRGSDFWQSSIRGEYRLTDLVKFVAITSYQHLNEYRNQDVDGAATNNTQSLGIGDIKSFSQELRLTGDGGPLNWIVGANYDHTKAHDAQQIDSSAASLSKVFPDLPRISTAANSLNQRIKNYAMFANGEFKINDALVATAGIRYTKSDRSGVACLRDATPTSGLSAVYNSLQQLLQTFGLKTTPLVNIVPGQCLSLNETLSPDVDGTPVGLKEDNVSWRLGLNYKTPGRTLLYATASRGYKSGILPFISASQALQYSPAKQERVNAYEVGFKAPLGDGRARLNAAAFYYDYRDKQVRGRVQDLIFGLLERMLNVPKSRIWGLEAEFLARPLRGLTVSAAGTYLNSRIVSDFITYAQGANNPADLNNFKGAALSYTPKWSANADAQYDFAISDRLKGFVGSTVTYRGKDSASLQTDARRYPDFQLRPYALLDLRAGLTTADSVWRFELFGRNVTNKFYETTVFRPTDSLHRYLGRPATYGASVRYRFG